ncbi:MAG: outer membrane beta-barrel protein, partial [Methylophilaceae bacterium]
AWHPTHKDFVLFSRLDLVDKQSNVVNSTNNATDNSGKTHTQKIIHNVHYNRKINKKTQVSVHHGIKHIIDKNNQSKSTTTVDTGTVEVRYDIKKRWDVGARAGYLKDWSANTTKKVAGVSLGMRPTKNIWLEQGYNFEGFDDDDFDDSSYKHEGAYLSFRYKF